MIRASLVLNWVIDSELQYSWFRDCYHCVSLSRYQDQDFHVFGKIGIGLGLETECSEVKVSFNKRSLIISKSIN